MKLDRDYELRCDEPQSRAEQTARRARKKHRELIGGFVIGWDAVRAMYRVSRGTWSSYHLSKGGAIAAARARMMGVPASVDGVKDHAMAAEPPRSTASADIPFDLRVLAVRAACAAACDGTTIHDIEGRSSNPDRHFLRALIAAALGPELGLSREQLAPAMGLSSPCLGVDIREHRSSVESSQWAGKITTIRRAVRAALQGAAA